MNSRFGYLAAFAAGVVAGGAAVWELARRRYERIAEEEIRSVKETYSKKKAAAVTPAEREEPIQQSESPASAESVVEYAARLRKEGYLPKEGDEKEAKSMPDPDVPYVISPDEFGEMDGYAEISLTYYADGVLADENDEAVDNVKEIVGSDFHDHFGEYEADSVFVRNDKLMCDYEILADHRSYSDILEAKPYLRRKE